MADPNRRDENHQSESTPYGPHPDGIDEASGGADSSPFENLPSGEKAAAAAERARAKGSPGEPPPG
jgi:hypothetical protein